MNINISPKVRFYLHQYNVTALLITLRGLSKNEISLVGNLFSATTPTVRAFTSTDKLPAYTEKFESFGFTVAISEDLLPYMKDNIEIKFSLNPLKKELVVKGVKSFALSTVRQGENEPYL